MNTLLFLLMVHHCCAVNMKYARVVSGNTASLGQYPFMAMLQREGFKCSSSIVSPSWVITAGHCVEDPDVSLYWVNAGVVDVLKGVAGKKQTRTVTQIATYPNFTHYTKKFRDILTYDIALVKVCDPFVFNTTAVGSVGLSSVMPPISKDECIGLGFGATVVTDDVMVWLRPPRKNKYSGRSGTLKSIKVGQVSKPVPCTKFGDTRWRHKYQICSIGGMVNQSHLYLGDSGGPLLCGGVLIGVFSVLEGIWFHDEHHIVQVHTATAPVRGWIQSLVPDAEFYTRCSDEGWKPCRKSGEKPCQC